jgi:hypothetical protein
VERTLGLADVGRRLARDHETLPARSEAMIHLAMNDLMARRLTGEATVSWRDPASGIKRYLRDETPGEIDLSSAIRVAVLRGSRSLLTAIPAFPGGEREVWGLEGGVGQAAAAATTGCLVRRDS